MYAGDGLVCDRLSHVKLVPSTQSSCRPMQGGRVVLVDFGGVQDAVKGQDFGTTVIGTYGYMVSVGMADPV